MRLLRISPGQPQERKAGLRLVAAPGGLPVGSFGVVQFAGEPLHFALLVKAAVKRLGVTPDGTSLGRGCCLQRFGPGPVQPEELGPV